MGWTEHWGTPDPNAASTTLGDPSTTTPLTAPAPSTALATSVGVVAARSAAERQRKRASAGSTLVSHPMQSGLPGAKLQPLTLLGF